MVREGAPLDMNSVRHRHIILAGRSIISPLANPKIIFLIVHVIHEFSI